MATTCEIIRRSIHTYLQNYQYFTFVASILALPFSLAVFASQVIIPRYSTLLPTINIRLCLLFGANIFSPFSSFFAFVTLKLSQTISSAIITLPFVISFLLLAKASVIISLKKQPSMYFISLYASLLSTHLFNSFIIFSLNATCFSLFSLLFSFLDRFLVTSPKLVIFLSVTGLLFYSLVLAYALVICNLALVSSGMEEGKRSGFTAISRACIMIRGKIGTSLGLVLSVNLGLAAIEALFNFRIKTGIDRQLWLLVTEGVLVSYLYSIILVLEVIMNCLFYHNCKESDSSGYHRDKDYCFYDEIAEKFKGFDELL